jgi:ATP-dependent DNA ligase
MKRRAELVDEISAYRIEPGDPSHPWSRWIEAEAHMTGKRMPGGGSRWNAGKDLSFEFLRADLVCEVAYDHLQGDRFRHATTFRRWRPDRDPGSCTYGQLETVVPAELHALFSGS